MNQKGQGVVEWILNWGWIIIVIVIAVVFVWMFAKTSCELEGGNIIEPNGTCWLEEESWDCAFDGWEETGKLLNCYTLHDLQDYEAGGYHCSEGRCVPCEFSRCGKKMNECKERFGEDYEYVTVLWGFEGGQKVRCSKSLNEIKCDHEKICNKKIYKQTRTRIEVD